MRSARLLFFSLFLLTHVLFAGNTGKIAGTITDAKTKEGLVGVNILVVGTSMGAVTDIEGSFTIIGVPPGTYTLKASLIGYNSFTVSNISVNIDLTTRQDFVLTETTVEVKEFVIVAEKKMVQQDMTASTAVMSKELISNLAVTQARDVIQLQAGITVSPGGELHLRGGRAGQIAYQIDGVTVTDAYDGSNTIDLGANAIQELQVVSGAFNAEYGQAMSGVVNIVTKDGGDNLSGNVQAYTGAHLSQNSDVFWNINNQPITSIRNVEASLSGPIISDKLYFYMNGRAFGNTGYFYGKRVFLTDDVATENTESAGQYFISQNGNGDYVALNPDTRYFYQGKASYRLSQSIKIMYNYIFDYRNYKDFDNGIKLTPDNNLNRFNKTFSNIFTLNQTLSASSFYNLSISYLFKDYHHYLFENIYTGDWWRPTLYVNNDDRKTPPYSFGVGGTTTNRFHRNTGTYDIKIDWVNQLNKEISLQAGVDLKEHRIYFQNINLLNGSGYPYNVIIPRATTQDFDEYFHKPKEGAFYVQSKFEAFNLIFNAGVRFDYFDPNAMVLNDDHSNPSDPLYYQYTVNDPNINNPLKPNNKFFDDNKNGVQDPGEATKTVQDRLQYWYKKAKVKTQVSPRLGLAFPISADGVIHFSYGHFFQLPSYEMMYTNPDFELGVGSGNQGLFGNADLKAQRTIKGEIGLKQQLSEDIAADITMFFEDFRNLTGTQTDDILVFGGAQSYSKYANSDFGYAKGIVLKLEKRLSENFAVNLDYTFSIAKGNASNPADSRNAILGGATPETYIAPLDWDQTHTLNIIAAYNQSHNWGVSIISSFYTGQPYTPAVSQYSIIKENAYPRNSGYKPNIFNIDLRANKDITFGSTTLSLYCRVYNLLDLNNARSVNANSGDPAFTFDKLQARNINPRMYYNTLDEYYTNPGNYSEPRRVEVGTSWIF